MLLFAVCLFFLYVWYFLLELFVQPISYLVTLLLVFWKCNTIRFFYKYRYVKEHNPEISENLSLNLEKYQKNSHRNSSIQYYERMVHRRRDIISSSVVPDKTLLINPRIHIARIFQITLWYVVRSTIDRSLSFSREKDIICKSRNHWIIIIVIYGENVCFV